MGGLSQISPSSASAGAQVLSPTQQQTAQNQTLGNIGALSSFTHPFQANQLTQTQAFNPFAPTAQAGANTAMTYGTQAAQNQFNVGGGLETLGGPTGPLQTAGNQVLNTAFDPQSALYQRYLQLTQQQFQAANAQSGVGSTPYAAGLNAQNLQNFNISWNAQQLANQIAGLNAADTAFGTAGGLQTAGAGLQAGAPTLALQSAMYPYLTSEQIASTGMGALDALQQYGMTAPQQQIQDLLALLGQVPAFQNANTQAVQTQANIQNQNMQQIMKAIAGGAGLAAAPFTGGTSLGLTNLGLMGTNPFQNAGGAFGVPGSNMFSQA